MTSKTFFFYMYNGYEQLVLHNSIIWFATCIFTASQFLWCDGERTDGWPPAQQGTDCRDAGDCVYTREVGHHHPEEWREDVHPARQPRHNCEYLVSFPHPHQDLVSCPAHVRLPARNSLVNEVEFLGLLPKSGNDQWDCEIGNCYSALPLQQ